MSANVPSGGEPMNQDPAQIAAKLHSLRQRYTLSELAQAVGVSNRTVARWLASPSRIPAVGAKAISALATDSFFRTGSFRFVDLFAGIGGIRLAFERNSGHCVWTSEWDRYSQRTYMANFPSTEYIAGDITQVAAQDVPDHDVLLAGFPCQPFSIAGVSKRNSLGLPSGFGCLTQGTLFFDVARILEAKRPAAFLLENVKHLLTHDKGNTFQIIFDTLTRELGYEVHYKVLDAKPFVPQHRERLVIVGFRSRTDFTWDDVHMPDDRPTLTAILHPEDGTEEEQPPYTMGPMGKVNRKYVISDRLWDYLQAYADKHRAKGNGFGYGLAGAGDVARTLSARYFKDGSEILIRTDNGNPRRLTPREAARIMGFPDSFVIPVSDTQAYRQFGNSVAVPLISAVAQAMKPHILASLGDKPSQQQLRLFL